MHHTNIAKPRVRTTFPFISFAKNNSSRAMPYRKVTVRNIDYSIVTISANTNVNIDAPLSGSKYPFLLQRHQSTLNLQPTPCFVSFISYPLLRSKHYIASVLIFLYTSSILFANVLPSQWKTGKVRLLKRRKLIYGIELGVNVPKD